MEKNVIDQYISEFDQDLQPRLREIYHIIRATAPEATEKISWGMPTFYLNGNLVHFAQQKAHVGFYPGASGVANFEDKLKGYKHSKGAIQFPNNKPLPEDLIIEIVRFRVGEQKK